MTIRPVDMQVVMHRAMESSRTSANENARPVTEQQQFAQQVQRNASHEQQSVVETHRGEGQNVNRDGKGNSGGYNRQKKKRGSAPGQDSLAPGQKPEQRKSLLDISL